MALLRNELTVVGASAGGASRLVLVHLPLWSGLEDAAAFNFGGVEALAAPAAAFN